MNKILKYELPNLDTGGLREIEMPQGARILAVQVQVNQEVFKAEVGHGFGPAKAYGPITETVCLWAMSNTDESRKVRRMIRVYGTGRPIEEPLESLNYIGTVQVGPFVWHVFERNVSGMKIRKVKP